ncbi:MAG: peptidase [Alphaproteobacteria bacterium PA3]|nr:MAG: peptidase [Alphaproteobacteria bacterium PA3]
MPILIILGILALLALIFGPQYWVKSVMARHAADRPDFPGTGGELARHLLDEAGLADVGLEETPAGTDHYDPIARVVRLSPNNLTGRSVTAVAVAAHEVGHAVQHRDGDPFLVTRTKWAGGLAGLDKVAFWMLISIPLIGIIIKSPVIAMLQIGAIVALMSGRVLMHVLTLPMEIDASFKRALPVLEHGGFLHEDDLVSARQVLKAAAGTYVASALATLLDVLRWIR